MKKYIVSLVFGKMIKGVWGPNKEMLQEPQVDVQNLLLVLSAESAEAAYERCRTRGIAQYPQHRIIVKIVVEADDASLEG